MVADSGAQISVVPSTLVLPSQFLGKDITLYGVGSKAKS